VANPFAIGNLSGLASSAPAVYQDLKTQSFFTSATIRKNQLLRPFPEMNGLVNTGAPVGEAKSHGLEVSVEKRFSRGFNFSFGYTRLWLREADFFFNEFDAAPSWQTSNDGRPHRVVATGIWELPFGRGRYLARHGIANALLGGFQMALTWEYQPGALLNWGNLFYSGNVDQIAVASPTLDRWFNTDNFERNSAKVPAAFQARVFPTRVDDVRQDSTNYWSGNIAREFRIRETIRLQLRLDALNMFNRSNFAAPNVNPVSTLFGKVTAVTPTNKRWLQIQARIRF
jgi:outer membrane receptor protein involved in Fe transport